MRKYVFIAIGGVLGAVLRYYIKNSYIFNYKEAMPLITLLINITGTFVLAFILTTAFEVQEFDQDMRLAIATGFLGAYTTFSTMCRETASLINSGLYCFASSYIALSAILGLGAAYLGVVLSRKLVSIMVEGGKNEDIT